MTEQNLKEAIETTREWLIKNGMIGGISITMTDANVDLVLSALDKQIPKKPKENLYRHDELCAGICVCGGVVYKGNCVYCPHCGQKLDWSKKDD